MFSLLLRLKRRVKKILKVQSESRQIARTTVYSRTRKTIMLIMAALLVGTLYPGEDLYDPLDMPRRGEIAREDVIARFPITVYKSDSELDSEMDVVRRTVPQVVDYDTSVVRDALALLDSLFVLVDSARAAASSNDTAAVRVVKQRIGQRFPLLSEGAIRRSLTIDAPEIAHRVIADVYREDIYRVGVIGDENSLDEASTRMVLVRRGERESIHPLERVLTSSRANVALLGALNRRSATDSIDVEYCYLVGHTFVRANLTVNREEYRRRLDEELSSVSNVKEVVNTGDIIVRSGTRISDRQQRIMEEMARILRVEAAEKGWFATYSPVLVRIVLVLALFAALYLFLYYFRREVFNSNPKLLALFLVFALQLLLMDLARMVGDSMYLLPIAVLGIMITILFDAEVGVLSTVALSLLLGVMHRFDFSLAFLTMTVGTTACFASRRVRRRSDFFKIGLSVAVAYALFALMVETMKFTPNVEVMRDVGYGSAIGILSALLTIGILPVFEYLFGITTDITLLELSDMNHPLLKRLAVETPGTYQHSIIVGNLSEAAAKAIRANSLLARVGAYFHDIGKVETPEYFVENQLSVKSKHDELPPSMSALVLASHVKRGRTLGEEADIPDDVLNFIEEHHGTMVMSFFYNRALEQGADESVMDKFRYPGPKPQIRETGIAMLADAVEAASRTLDDPKPARINNLIQRIINDRFQSGELDECPLTLRDLARIKEAFAQVLVASFHHRVVYPQKPGDTEPGEV